MRWKVWIDSNTAQGDENYVSYIKVIIRKVGKYYMCLADGIVVYTIVYGAYE